MIVIKRPVGFTMVLRAANAAAYPAETADPLNVDVFWAYADEPQNRRYAGTYPPNSKVKIPLATDLDRDVVVTTNSRSGVGVQQKNDAADAPSSTLQSEREQRKPVIGLINNTTNLQANIGVSFYPRHMRARRIKVASDAGFTSIIATYYEDVDKSAAETPRLPEVFRLIRAVPGSGTATYYVKVAHSSFSTALRTEATQQLKLEALRWGPDSDPLTVTFADSNGAGGSTGTFNPFIATIDGYGGAPNTFLLTIPLTGETSGITGTDGGFSDHLGVWTGTGVLNYNFGLAVHRALNVVRANGFKNTVSAINVKTNENYFASGSAYTTTGSINSGQNTLTMPNNGHDFRIGQGISVAGAGVAGATLYTTIQAISNDLLTITLNANASTTVSGAAVAHDDQVAIQNAINDAASAGYRTLFLPSGTYRVRGLSLVGEVCLVGENKKTTILASPYNAPIVTIAKDPVTYQGPMLSQVTIRGDVAAGSAQIGLVCDDVEYVFMVTVMQVRIENCGGIGLFVGKTFSSHWQNVYIDNCAGYPLVYDARNMPKNIFDNVYVGLLRDTAKVGFRIKAGEFFARNCNGVNSLNDDSVFAVVGRKNGVDGDTTDEGAQAVWEHCNFETLTKSHVIHYKNASSQFRGICTFAAQAYLLMDTGGISAGATTLTLNHTLGLPSSGKGQMGTETLSWSGKTATQLTGLTRGIDGTTAVSHAQFDILNNKQFKPIVYEVDDVTNYPQLVARGYIEDSCSFADGPETNYANNQAIHANALPPLQTMGKGATVNPGNASAALATWWNSTTSKIEVLPRADGMMKRVTITGTTVFSNPGLRLIEINNTSGAAMDLTLPPAIWYKTQEFIIVKDVAGNAKTYPITVYGGGGAQVEGSSFIMNENKQACIFFPNEADTVNGSWRLAATYPIPGSVKKTGAGHTDFIPIFTADDVITGGPLYRINGNTIVSKDAIIAETDNAKDIGGDGFNRFRDIHAARKFKGPAFVTPGANGMYGGSADPEGNQTAEPGSIYLRTNGNLYKKTNGSGNTGWTLISTGVGVSGSGLATFFTQFTNDSTIEAAPMYESGGSIISQEFILPETNNSKDLGSAALKWRSGYFGTKVQTVTYEFTNGVTIITGTGSPEGVVSAFAGSLYLDDGGALYRKSSGSGNTGWTLVSNAGLANTALSNLSGVAINAALIANTNNAYDLGSAALKWRTGYFGTKIQTVVFEFTNGLTLTTGSGNPEGVVSAFLGSLYLDDSGGILYRKASGFGNTGWTAVGGANTALSNLASVAINASLIANANNTLDLGSTGTRWRTGYFGTSLVTPLLALESRTDPGSPANGDAWNSSDRNAVSVRIAGQTEDVVTSMWRNSAAASFDTTTTETSMLSDTGVGTKTLAANRLKVGNQVRVKLAGTYGTKATSPGNFTILLKNGATTMATISAFGLPANVVDQNWWIEAAGTVTATGASGNILWTINFYYNDGTGTLKGRPYTVNSAIIDTTASKLIDVTGQFSVSDANNFWETVTASIELVA